MRYLTLSAIIIVATGCTRRPLSDCGCNNPDEPTYKIEVSIDWSASGIDPDEEYVHRASFRFFPADGSLAFDRYLEDNITDGVIELPEGEYSVVVYNEAFNDIYWQDAVQFENVDSYDLFAAKIVEQPADAFDFYQPEEEEETLSVQPLKLASGSVQQFTVSGDMLTSNALNPITLRRLTCPTTIEVETENLSSAYTMHAALTGLSQRVFMASGDTDDSTITHISKLTQRTWSDSAEQDGVIYEKLLTFSTPATNTGHILTLGVILVDGSKHEPEEEMVYDVTDQILNPTTRYADDDLGARVSLSLPEVSGDIEVDDWGNSEQITIQ